MIVITDDMCTCPLCGAPRERIVDYKWLNGLSVRSKNALIQFGFKSKEEIKIYLDEKRSLWRIPGVGKMLEAEIINWMNA